MMPKRPTKRAALSALEVLTAYVESMNQERSPFGLDPFCCGLLTHLRRLKRSMTGEKD
jgi:hypothetical protein